MQNPQIGDNDSCCSDNQVPGDFRRGICNQNEKKVRLIQGIRRSAPNGRDKVPA